MIHFRVNTVLDLGLYLHLPIRDLGRSRSKKSLIVIEIEAGKLPTHIGPVMIGEINTALKNTETITNNPNIEMIVNLSIEMTVIETEKIKGIMIVIEIETENMMIVEIEETETEKEVDLETKTEEIKNKNLKTLNKLLTLITNYYHTKSPCLFKSQCHQSPDSVVEDNGPDHHLVIIEGTKIITKEISGTLFHGYPESTILPMFHHQHWLTLKK